MESALSGGREQYDRQAWSRAYEQLSAADRSASLGPSDLERLATSAYMLGREQEYRELMERAYPAHLDSGDELAAVRCAFWITMNLASNGELGRASGWLGRAERLLDRSDGDCVERGYVLLPRTFELEAEGSLESAAEAAAEALSIGERFADPDLVSLAAMAQGAALIGLSRLREGVGLLDMAMVAVVGGEVSPIVSGIVYCAVILACEEAHDLRRAREWTTALSDWCEAQPDLVAFTGRCRVHRAQLMRMRGSWDEAIEEARRAAERALREENPVAAGEAHYQRGEVHRLRGEDGAAEEAYGQASAQGREPQPGLALLRLSQGDGQAAATAIRRVTAEADGAGRRAALLPAYVEIMCATGDLDAAQPGCTELEEIALAEEKPGLSRRRPRTRGAPPSSRPDARRRPSPRSVGQPSSGGSSRFPTRAPARGS